MSTQSLTLFEIDRDLYRLYEERQEMMDLTCVTAEAEQERAVIVRGIDGEISERLKALDKKVDGIAYLVKEFESRAAIHAAEAKRLKELAQREDATAKEIKQRAAEVLALRLTPEQITQATQGTKLLEVRGRQNVLKLHKNPPSLAESQMDLLPEEFIAVRVKMQRDTWDYLCSLASDAGSDGSGDVVQSELEAGLILVSEPEPMKPEIIARLKQMVSCETCGGKGMLDAGDIEIHPWPCDGCGGSGQVRATVPGAQLIEDGVHVRIG